MRIRSMLAVSVVLGFAVGASAQTLNIEVSTGFGDTWKSAVDGVPVSADVFAYEGSQSDKDWSLSYDLEADGDPFIAGDFSVTNNGAVAQTINVKFSTLVTIDIPQALASYGGSTGGSVTDANFDGAGGIATVEPTPFYQASIAGTPVLNIYDWPAAFGFGFAGETAAVPVANVGLPGATIASPVGVNIGDTIMIEHNFQLSPGDSASLTSFFEVVPEPVSLVLFGLGGLALIRRRR